MNLDNINVGLIFSTIQQVNSIRHSLNQMGILGKHNHDSYGREQQGGFSLHKLLNPNSRSGEQYESAYREPYSFMFSRRPEYKEAPTKRTRETHTRRGSYSRESYSPRVNRRRLF